MFFGRQLWDIYLFTKRKTLTSVSTEKLVRKIYLSYCFMLMSEIFKDVFEVPILVSVLAFCPGTKGRDVYSMPLLLVSKFKIPVWPRSMDYMCRELSYRCVQDQLNISLDT